MDKIGKLLKERRQCLNYSLEEVATKLKIRKKYLIAIEENDYGNLPASVYIVGYIKTYSKFLNIDETNYIEDIKQYNIPNNIIDIPSISDYKPNNITIFASLLILFLVYFTCNNMIFNKNANVNNFASIEDLIEVQSVNASNIKRYYNKDQFAVLATNDCDIKIFDHDGKLFDNKKLNVGEIYFVSNKIELTIAVSNKDKVEIFNNKDFKI